MVNEQVAHLNTVHEKVDGVIVTSAQKLGGIKDTRINVYEMELVETIEA